MRIRKAAIILLAFILAGGIALTAYFILSKNDNDGEFMSNQENYDLIDMLVESDEAYFEDDVIEAYKAEHPDMEEEMLSDYPEYYYFISGMFAVHDGESDQAFTYLTSCLNFLKLPYYESLDDQSDYTDQLAKNISKDYADTERYIAGRSYYELIRMCVNNSVYDQIDTYIEDFNTVLGNGPDNVISLKIIMTDWLIYDIANIPNGVEKEIELAEANVELALSIEYDDMATVYAAAADSYISDDNTLKFIDYELKALEDAIEDGEDYYAGLLRGNIGNEYLIDKNYDEAETYLLQAYETDIEDEDSKAELKSYISNLLISLEVKMENQEAAQQYIEENEKWVEKETDTTLQRDDYTNLLLVKAEYECAFGTADQALEYIKECEERYNNTDNFQYSDFYTDLYNVYGQICYELEQYDTALDYYKKVASYRNECGLPESEDCLKGQYACYKALKDSNGTQEYADLIIEYQTEKINKNNTHDATYFLEKFNSDQKDSQIASLENQGKWFKIFGMLVLLIILAGAQQLYHVIKLNKKIKLLSETDGLTGIHNRRKLDDYLSKNWNKLKYGTQVAVVMIDVDFFKKYNDFYGHLKGDQALVNVAKCLTDNIKEEDFAARYGGEEFLIVIQNTDEEDIKEKLENIRKSISNLHIEHEKSSVNQYLTISVGYAIFGEDSPEGYEAAISCADTALYQAKEVRNSVVEYEKNSYEKEN